MAAEEGQPSRLLPPARHASEEFIDLGSTKAWAGLYALVDRAYDVDSRRYLVSATRMVRKVFASYRLSGKSDKLRWSMEA